MRNSTLLLMIAGVVGATLACGATEKGKNRNQTAAGAGAGGAGLAGSTGVPGVAGAPPINTTPALNDDACAAAKTKGSSEGCEFYAVVPASPDFINGSCFAAVLVNSSTTPVSINVEHDGTTLNVEGMARIPKGNGENINYEPLPKEGLPSGQMAVLFLTHAPNDHIPEEPPYPCPEGIVPGLTVDPAVKTSGRGYAFRITTKTPVSAYDIFPYPSNVQQGISSATLLLPTASWGTNYIAVDAYQTDPHDPDGKRFQEACQPFLQFVAQEDDTEVTIVPNGILPPGVGVLGADPGQSRTYKLEKGEVIQFMQPWGTSPTQRARWAGSPISSSKPISVLSGAPGGTSYSRDDFSRPFGGCPSSHQQLVPVNTLGSEYTAVRHRDRDPKYPEIGPWTVVGAVDGTRLEYDPARPAGAPETINSGQEVIFNSPEAFSVRSADDQHPFYLTSHMPGFWVMTDFDLDVGQPEFVNVIPPAQWLTSYVFLTDPTYPNTHFLFTRRPATDGTFKDVTLGCLGNVTNWQPIGTAKKYEYARVDVMASGKPVGACSNGPHTAKSEAPFSVTVWGWGHIVSYAYPAGGGLKPINNVVVAAPK